MVAVWRCGHLKSTFMREFGSTQCSVDTIDAHWAIRLLIWFESGFSADRLLAARELQTLAWKVL